jgi:hypothetical protein
MNLKYFENIDGSWIDITGQTGASLEYDAEASGWVTTTGKYKKYVAQLNQSGGDPPSATVIENTLGFVPSWSYTGGSIYGFDWDGDFVANKCFIIFTNGGIKQVWYSFNDTYDINIYSSGDDYIINASFELRYYN